MLVRNDRCDEQNMLISKLCSHEQTNDGRKQLRIPLQKKTLKIKNVRINKSKVQVSQQKSFTQLHDYITKKFSLSYVKLSN